MAEMSGRDFIGFVGVALLVAGLTDLESFRFLFNDYEKRDMRFLKFFRGLPRASWRWRNIY